MIRFLILLLGLVTTMARKPGAASPRAGDRDDWRQADPEWVHADPEDWEEADPEDWEEADGHEWVEAAGPVWSRGPGPPRHWPVRPESPSRSRPTRAARAGRGRSGGNERSARRRRIPLWVKWSAALALTALIFRKAIAYAVLLTLSAALHLIGVNVHLPSIRLAWPWTSITSGSITDTEVGPWVLQKIEGISKPALGTENFNFVFTHKVSKNIGFWPCWYSSTFDAVGRASATVNLNPGSGWWAPPSGHYQLQVLSRPLAGQPGRVAVSIVLPLPQLPQSVHDISVDNTMSRPVDTQHSWTYPGFGCGMVIKPQFSVAVLYGLAQNMAYYQATHNPQVTRPLISAAEAEAAQIIRDDFIQPTVNALGYTLARFSLGWVRAALAVTAGSVADAGSEAEVGAAGISGGTGRVVAAISRALSTYTR